MESKAQVARLVVRLAEAEDLLEDIAVVVAAHAAFVVAGISGRGAVEKGRGEVVGAGSVGQQVGGLVDGLRCWTPSGGVKSLVSEYCGNCTACFMNVGPDGSGDARALDAAAVFRIKLGVIVVAHPHDAEQVLVKPANQASWLVPVLPAAGAVNPMLRTPAPVPQ